MPLAAFGSASNTTCAAFSSTGSDPAGTIGLVLLISSPWTRSGAPSSFFGLTVVVTVHGRNNWSAVNRSRVYWQIVSGQYSGTPRSAAQDRANAVRLFPQDCG